MKKIIFYIFILKSLVAPALHAQIVIKLCHENVTVFPWIIGSNKGLALKEIELIEKDLKIDIQLVRQPWKRCQMEGQAGKVDGLIAASYNEERAAWGQYPLLHDGRPNRDKRMHTDSFYVYVRKDSPINYHDEKFHHLGNNQIGVQLGYSVGKDLQDMGYEIHSTFSRSQDLFKQLDLGVLNVAVLQNHDALKTLEQFPELKRNIKRIDTPFKIKDQYIIFNKTFYQNNKKLADSIWDSLEDARKSKDYQLYESKLLK